MANLTLRQLLGGGGDIPLGGIEMMPLDASLPSLYVRDGKTFLATGALIANDGGYADLLAARPGDGLIAVAGRNWQGFNALNNTPPFLLPCNGRLFAVAPNGGITSTLYESSDSGATWVAKTISVSGEQDGCVMGSYVLLSGVAGNGVYRRSFDGGESGTYTMTSGVTYCVAARPDGALAVAAGNLGATSGNVWTADSPSNWTSRVPGGSTTTDGVRIAHWSPCGNCFIYATQNALRTTTNGYYLTAPTYPSLNIVNNYGGCYAASSPTSTLISADNKLLRTTNATAFAEVTLPGWLTGTRWPIRYLAGAYYLATENALMVSIDDGLTFSKLANVLGIDAALGYSLAGLDYQAGTWFLHQYKASSPWRMASLAALAKTHIGRPKAFTQASAADATEIYKAFMRIK